MSEQEYSTVTELAKAAGASDEFVNSLKSRMAERSLVNHLIAIRGARGLSQKDVADQAGCTQSKISKFENSTDGDIKLADLKRYCQSLSLDFGVFFADKQLGTTDRIQWHAHQIAEGVDQMVQMAGDDVVIAGGAAKSTAENLLNIVRAVANSVKKLPNNPDNDEPFLRIEMRVLKNQHDADDQVTHDTNVKSPDEPILH